MHTCCACMAPRRGATTRAAPERLTVGDAQAILELGLDADLLKPGVDLRTTSVHQHGPHTHASQQHQIGNHTGLQMRMEGVIG